MIGEIRSFIIVIVICSFLTPVTIFGSINCSSDSGFDVIYGGYDDDGDGFLDVNFFDSGIVYANKGEPFDDVNTIAHEFCLQGDDPFYLDTVKTVVWCSDVTKYDPITACNDHILRIDNTIIGSPSDVSEHPWNDPDPNCPPESQCYQLTWAGLNTYIDINAVIAIYYDIPNIDYYYFFPTRNSDHRDYCENGPDDDYVATYNLPNAQSSWNENYKVAAKGTFQCVVALYGYYDIDDKPYNPLKPSGPENGRVGYEYTYETRGYHPNGYKNPIRYGWDWDDGSSIEWTGEYLSGDYVQRAHIWNEIGTYDVKVKSRDNRGLESDWSDPLTVVISDPQLEDKIFDYLPDLPPKERWMGTLFEPDVGYIKFNGRQVINHVENQNDIFLFQTNTGEASIGWNYEVPVIDGEGILHKARIAVDKGSYEKYLEISGFLQFANIKVDILVEELDSEYTRAETVYSDSLDGWGLEYIINFDGDYSYKNFDSWASLTENGNVWLYMDLKEGYNYNFWARLTSGITTAGLPKYIIEKLLRISFPFDMLGFAKSDNSINIDSLKLEWLDNSFSMSFGGNHRPDIPDKPSYTNSDYIIGDHVDFSATLSDPDGDNVQCRWYWGDGTYSDWMGPYFSGKTVTRSHVFQKAGTYYVRVEAKDSNDVFSGVSSSNSISIGASEPKGTININSPSGKNIEWKKNKNYQISWIAEGDVGESISVDLVRYNKNEDKYESVSPITVVDSDVTSCSYTPVVSNSGDYHIAVYGKNSCSFNLSNSIKIVGGTSRSRVGLRVFEIFERLFERYPILYNLFTVYSNI